MDVIPTGAPEVRSGDKWRILAVIPAMIILSDLTLFRARGFSGPAVFAPCAALLIALGCAGRNSHRMAIVCGVLLLTVAARLVWSGSWLAIFLELWLLNAFAMTLHGTLPYLLESIVFLAGTIPGGFECLQAFRIGLRKSVIDPVDRGTSSPVFNYLLPALSVVIFGTLFVLANPDLVSRVSGVFGDLLTHVQDWLKNFTFGELTFWCAVAWLTAGVLSPLSTDVLKGLAPPSESPATGESSQMYVAFRNTLVSLILLFAVYLTFEFLTLWFRQFPEGFHYFGYAHEGAAWLTAALALATMVLSLMFRGPMLQHPQIRMLRRMAWVWSALNLLLAASVYNRLLIYVDFNGMTRMRVVGFLGISSVVFGFLLVLRKIRRESSFSWLIRHQLLVPAFAVYVYVVAPVDSLVHRYNVRMILAGHPQPSVQISEHPFEDAASPVLIPLLQCNDPLIREGIRAILDSRLKQMDSQRSRLAELHWTAWQSGTEHAYQQLTALRSELTNPSGETAAQHAREAFRTYAMQWW